MVLSFVKNWLGFIWRSLIAILVKKPGFIGERRLHKFIKNNAHAFERITILTTGIKISKRFYPLTLPILDFVPFEGIQMEREDINDSYLNLRKYIRADDSSVDLKYFRAAALFIFTALGSIGANLVVISSIERAIETSLLWQVVVTAAWLMANVYFIIQLIIYHLAKLKAIKIIHTFKEASAVDLEKLNKREKLPVVQTIIPSFMEAPKLIRNSLYAHCLQRYFKRQIVLLLDNQVSQDPYVITNTEENVEVVNALNSEMQQMRVVVEKFISEVSLLAKTNSAELVLSKLANFYSEISDWFASKFNEVGLDVDDDYPTKPFFLEHTFKSQEGYYRAKAFEYLSLSQETETAPIDLPILLGTSIKECRGIFNATVSIFQRHKYENTVHEKTKAGNLTAYLSLLGKNWKEEINKEGNLCLAIDGSPDENTPDYVAIFDADTIAKPDYLIRKVVFMEKPENSKVGLVQSPYNVPDPEPTSAGSASGIHSQWFLPIAIGLSSYRSSFWLGINAVFRKEAILKIEGSFTAETVVEDTEISLKLILHGYEIITSPEYQCQTFSPPDMRGIHVQRQRWASGGFQIVSKYIKDVLAGKYNNRSAKEVILRINYITSLNMLPLAITVTLLFQYPYYKTVYGIELVPLFFYLLTYCACLKPTGYRIVHYFDGLTANYIMNFHYLRGTILSLKSFIIKGTSIVFKSTPRTRNSYKMPLGFFEIFGLCFLIPALTYRLFENANSGRLWDIYTTFALFCFIYGIIRLIGGLAFLRNVAGVLKNKS